MYIPHLNKNDNMDDLFTFMQRFPFALLISMVNNKPFATHLPFVVNKENDELFLQSHMALANPQWKNIDDQEVLIVFSEPHAYVSPFNYDNHESVPTWNYITVHVYGTVKLMDEIQTQQLLHRTVNLFEPAYASRYAALDPAYITKMMNGIKAFDVNISHIEGKYKLSQNKTAHEQQKVIHHLEQQHNTNAYIIAQYMVHNINKQNK